MKLKHLFFSTISILVLATISAHASASQGLYGNVYANTDWNLFYNPITTSESCTVDNAVVDVYTSGWSYVTSVTTSVCGYYSVNLALGTYHLIVDGVYDARKVSSCSTIYLYDEDLYGERTLSVSSGFWSQRHLYTF